MQPERVDAVTPVLDEVRMLEQSVGTLRVRFHQAFPYDWRIVIARSGSTDATGKRAASLGASCRDAGSIARNGRGESKRYAAARNPRASRGLTWGASRWPTE